MSLMLYLAMAFADPTATRAIGPGEVLTADDVTDGDAIVGRVVSRARLPGEQIRESDLAEPGGPEGIEAWLASRKAVRVVPALPLRTVSAGMHVDLIRAGDTPCFVAKNVQVLAIEGDFGVRTHPEQGMASALHVATKGPVRDKVRVMFRNPLDDATPGPVCE